MKSTLSKSRLTAQSQVSVPKEARRRLGVGAGSVIEWDAEGDRIVVRRAGKHTADETHQALFPARPKARDLATLKEGVRQYVRRRNARR